MDKRRSRFATLLPVAVACTALILLIGLSVNDMKARQEQRFTGKENHVIDLDQATKYVQNFAKKPAAPKIKGAYFGRDIFDKLLSQPGCIGLRYYYGQKDDGASTIVLVGVDTTGNDLIEGVLAEEAVPCPPFCPAPNNLNK